MNEKNSNCSIMFMSIVYCVRLELTEIYHFDRKKKKKYENQDETFVIDFNTKKHRISK